MFDNLGYSLPMERSVIAMVVCGVCLVAALVVAVRGDGILALLLMFTAAAALGATRRS